MERTALSYVRGLLVPVLIQFVLPSLGAAGAWVALRQYDHDALISIHQGLEADETLTPAEREDIERGWSAAPPSTVCLTVDPARAEARAALCAPFSDLWQLTAGWVASIASFALGFAGVAASLVLGGAAWALPRLQYLVFRVGRIGFLALAGTLVTLQGAIAVWLSYWGTALLFDVYFPQIVVLTVVIAALGVWGAVRGLFQRVSTEEIDGELVAAERNPALWAHLTGLAGKVGTAPPSTLLAGIDDNFFVTEAPIIVSGQRIRGRTLYVSIPLLRVLSEAEADAVLAHELAHFRGGDTRRNARLGPSLVHFDRYLHTLAAAGLPTLPVQPVLFLFRAVFELARQRDSRTRELAADRVSAEVASVEHAARAMWKVVAYSHHRAAVESELFAVDERHAADALSIKDRAARGLAEHVASETFRESVAQGDVPHPFDSHPVLAERLAALGSPLDEHARAHVFDASPPTSWTDRFADADAIEERLWARYEARFSEVHEESLAYRFLPANEEQARIVALHFPPLVFSTRRGGTVRLTYAHVENADGAQLPYAEIARASVKDGTFRKTLRLDHVPNATAGRGPTIVRLSALDEPGAQQRLQDALTRYWHRDQVARAYAAQGSE